jgi:hypothetical protein
MERQITGGGSPGSDVAFARGKKLAKHIKESAAGDGQNQLWKYFSMSARAELEKGKPGHNDQLDLVVAEMQVLKKKVDAQSNVNISSGNLPQPYGLNTRWTFPGELEVHGMGLARIYGVPVRGVFVRSDGRTLEVLVDDEAFGSPQFSAFMAKLTEQTGWPVVSTPLSPLKEKE